MNATPAQLANLRPYRPGHAPTNRGKGGRKRNGLYDAIAKIAEVAVSVKIVMTSPYGAKLLSKSLYNRVNRNISRKGNTVTVRV